ncbi:MAG: branched-chain amino acid ABC transporter permease [Thermoplasmatota archaeon]
MVDLALVAQYVVNGLGFGAILALGAIGLSLVYGILNISNFAQGDFLTLGAFATLFFAKDLYVGLPRDALVVGLVLIAFVAVDVAWLKRLDRLERGSIGVFGALTAALGLALFARIDVGDVASHQSTALVLVAGGLVAVVAVVLVLVAGEFLVWRPLRAKRATTLTLVIVSIGVSLVLRSLLQLHFGVELISFNRPNIPGHVVGRVLISDAQIVTVVASLALIGLVHLFLRYTRAGKAMRAFADNPDLARVSGVDVDRMVIYVWVLTALLVTAAGVLLTLVQNDAINVNAGAGILLALFAAVILGGLGSAYGAAVGGFVVGIATKTSALWLGTKYEATAAFLVLIVVLLVRPQGILGGKI